jgi:hypothetical protein
VNVLSRCVKNRRRSRDMETITESEYLGVYEPVTVGSLMASSESTDGSCADNAASGKRPCPNHQQEGDVIEVVGQPSTDKDPFIGKLVPCVVCYFSNK